MIMIDWLIIYLFIYSNLKAVEQSHSSLPEGTYAYNYKVQHTRNYTKVQSNKLLQHR